VPVHSLVLVLVLMGVGLAVRDSSGGRLLN
jgi:hypothetical protein